MSNHKIRGSWMTLTLAKVMSATRYLGKINALIAPSFFTSHCEGEVLS